MSKFNPDIFTMPEYAPLAMWLEKYNAKFMWTGHAENGPTTQGYVVNGHLLIVMLYRPMPSSKIGAGWDIYLSADPHSALIATTLEAVEKSLGLSTERAS